MTVSRSKVGVAIELGNEGREAFIAAGSDEHSITPAPCLNANPDWIDVLAGIVRQNAAGWTDTAGTHVSSRS